MGLTTNRGQEKFDHLQEFSKKLAPIIEELNELIKEYKICPLDNILFLRPLNNQIAPFINYFDFPDPPASTNE